MTGISDLAQSIGSTNLKAVKTGMGKDGAVKGMVSGGVSNTPALFKASKRLAVQEINPDWKTFTGQAQKSAQLQSATNENAAMEAANTAQIAADAAAAEKKRRAGIMPTADDAAMKADKRRRAASAASAGGRESTVLTGQRLGD